MARPPHARQPPKKRLRTSKNQPAVEEIAFDDGARQDYLTGFHKRKVARTKHAQEIAEKRAREDRIRQRRKMREERRADLERHVKEVNDLIRPAGDDAFTNDEGSSDQESAEEWEGIPDSKPPPIDHEAEYIDEEKYTTVTVEEMDVSKDGIFRSGQGDGRSSEDETEAKNKITATTKSPRTGKRTWTQEKPKDSTKKPKKKKRNFRYESKGERKLSRAKQRLKNTRQADARRDN